MPQKAFSQQIDHLNITNKIQPITEDNIFRDTDYFNWCSSIIKGEDGKYHLIYSRWERSIGFGAWLTGSKIAHAVADAPEGPYRYVNTIIDLDQQIHKSGQLITAHNPKIKYFDGKYYLYFISTHLDRDITRDELNQTANVAYEHPNWKPLRENQRTYVATSNGIDGQWVINPNPILEPSGPITTLVVNPAITKGGDRRFYMIVKGDKPGTTKFERNQAIAVSNFPDKEFIIQSKPVIEEWDTEDVSMWYDIDQKRYYAIFHAHTYIGLMTSLNGVDWSKAANFEIMKKRIEHQNRAPISPDRMERPYVFIENNIPSVLSLAVKTNNNNIEDTYIVTIPLK